MRILFVNTFYFPNMPGGAEQSVKLLAEGLVQANNEVGVFCIDKEIVEQDVKDYNGVKIFRNSSYKFDLTKKKNSKIMQKIYGYYNGKCAKDFEKVCASFKPDIIHTNSLYGIPKHIWKVANKLSIPTIHTIRDTGLLSPVKFDRKCNPFIKYIHRIYMKKFSKYVTAVTAPSEYTLSTSLKVIPFKNAKIKKCIFNSVKIDYEKMKKIIESKKSRTSKKIKFMYAGRLVSFKGIEHMLISFSEIDNKECELHICGTGEMKNYVEDKAKKDSRIKYHGKLSNDELAKCYEECDVVIVPSYWPEPFGRVLIEGNMYGLPVIAGNCGGMPEIIKNTKAGELYTPKNVEELKINMTKMLDRNKIKKYLPKIEKNIGIYDIEYQVKAYIELYEFLLNH